jgi:hypothetical protein
VPLRRPLLVAAAALAIALGVTLGASAAPASAPADVATAFTTGFLTGDARLCDISSVETQALLARISQTADCAASMAAIRQGVVADADAAEKNELKIAYGAALVAAVDHYGALGGKAWFGKRFPIAALARAIHGGEPTLRVRLGTGPAAARASAANVVVLDRVRSTPKRLVLYGESGGGAIWRLSAAPTGKPALVRSTIRGVAAPVPPPSVTAFSFAPAVATDPTLVVTSFLEAGDREPNELLLTVGADGLVQSFLVGRAVVPPTAGTGAADATAFAAALTQAYSSPDAKELCGLFDPAFVTLLGGKCLIVDTAGAAVDVTTPAQRVSAADGTTLVVVRLGSAPNQLTTVHVAVPTATGYHVTGIFLDIAELIQLMTAPA